MGMEGDGAGSTETTLRWVGSPCLTDSGSRGGACILVTGLLLRDGLIITTLWISVAPF